MRTGFLVRAAGILGVGFLVVACSGGLPVKKQEYATLKSSRSLEHDFPTVWKGIESVFSKHRVIDRDPAKVSELELRKLESRTLETDWIYGESRDKYVEYQVNGSPRRKALQTRFKYRVEARRSIGGADVEVRLVEEVQPLKPSGEPAGWERATEVDSSRQAEILDRIQQAILSAAP